MVVSKKAFAYEERRLQILEQNKKKLEELNLPKLPQALRTTTSPKPSPMKKMKPKLPRQPVDLSTVRRSSRVADKPPPNYKDAPIEPLGRPRSYGYRRRDLSNRVYAADEGREYAVERAEELRSGLDPKFPSFVKPMLQSHVTGGFWLVSFNSGTVNCKVVTSQLKNQEFEGKKRFEHNSAVTQKPHLVEYLKQGLPVQFCKTHLPKRDETVTLVDEEGEEFPTKYLTLKTGLSGGWRGFAIDHELVDGDALVFHLIESTKFKVYIIRVNQAEDEKH